MLAAEINLPTPFPFPPFMSRTLKPPSRVNIPGIDHAFRSNADYPPFDGKNSTIMALRLAEGNFAHHLEFALGISNLFQLWRCRVLSGWNTIRNDESGIPESWWQTSGSRIQHSWKEGKKQVVRRRFLTTSL